MEDFIILPSFSHIFTLLLLLFNYFEALYAAFAHTAIHSEFIHQPLLVHYIKSQFSQLLGRRCSLVCLCELSIIPALPTVLAFLLRCFITELKCWWNMLYYMDSHTFCSHGPLLQWKNFIRTIKNNPRLILQKEKIICLINITHNRATMYHFIHYSFIHLAEQRCGSTVVVLEQ